MVHIINHLWLAFLNVSHIRLNIPHMAQIVIGTPCIHTALIKMITSALSTVHIPTLPCIVKQSGHSSNVAHLDS